jgi:glutaminyl-tRNA synthetase
MRNAESPAQHSALSTQHSTGTFLDNLNPNSLEVLTDCKLEPSLAGVPSPEGVPLPAGPPEPAPTATGRQAASGTPEVQYQFERHGYFCPDPDSTPDKLVFNRTVTLKDTWAKMAKKA